MNLGKKAYNLAEALNKKQKTFASRKIISRFEKSRICVIGCGDHVQSRLLPAVQKTDLFLSAVCSRHLENALACAAKFSSGNAYDDYREMIDRERPDGIIIAGPTDLHYKAGKYALEKGCHLFIEKPPASSLNEAMELIDIAGRSDRTIQVGLQSRFTPAYVKLKEFLDGGRLGKPILFEARLGVGQIPPDQELLSYIGIHMIDLVMFLFGKITDTFVRSFKLSNTWDAAYSISCICSVGTIGSITISGLETFNSLGARLEVTGEKGFVVVDKGTKLSYYSRHHQFLGVSSEPLGAVSPARVWEPGFGISDNSLDYNGFSGEMKAFEQLILDNKQPSTCLQNVLPVLELIEKIKNSRFA